LFQLHPLHKLRTSAGTFSTVYKAEDLFYNHYQNDWDLEEKENAQNKWISPPTKKRRIVEGQSQSKRKPKYVAIKQIYVTSSPSRILNELDLLNDLRGYDSVCPLITAFRNTDQVVAILPYFKHTDFREYFRKMTIPDVQIYFRSLFTALAAVHEAGILHRDIKPTNFLYEPSKRRGVLVDFGLAEREGTESKPCLCQNSPSDRKRYINNSVAAINGPANGYPKNDSRPSRRANRAGTRGFRAPEVLFKCTEQTTKIDVWSVGVILLTILSRRFPFFNSADDIEAMIEIATIFGSKRMKQAALLHGTVFETNIPTIGQQGFTLEKIILWSTCRSDSKNGEEVMLTDEEKGAVRFLERCFDLDPSKRISAAEALQHEFLAEEEMVEEEDELHML
jgi:cell division control protein 7